MESNRWASSGFLLASASHFELRTLVGHSSATALTNCERIFTNDPPTSVAFNRAFSIMRPAAVLSKMDRTQSGSAVTKRWMASRVTVVAFSDGMGAAPESVPDRPLSWPLVSGGGGELRGELKGLLVGLALGLGFVFARGRSGSSIEPQGGMRCLVWPTVRCISEGLNGSKKNETVLTWSKFSLVRVAIWVIGPSGALWPAAGESKMFKAFSGCWVYGWFYSLREKSEERDEGGPKSARGYEGTHICFPRVSVEDASSNLDWIELSADSFSCRQCTELTLWGGSFPSD